MALPQRQRVAVYGLARCGRSLLLVRASARADAHQRWWLPGGGVKFGEAPQTCLAREFAEETGLQVASARLRDAVSDVQSLDDESVLLHSVRLLYDVTVTPGVLLEQDGSMDEVDWVREPRLAELPLAPWLRAYLIDSPAW